MLASFLALAGLERRLVARAALTLLVARACRRGSSGWLRGCLRRGPADPARSAGRPSAERIGWAVSAVARRLPGCRNCLVQARAGQALLRRYGYAPSVRIGVARDVELLAHAWVEADGKVVIGGATDRYHALRSPRGGA